jgi:WD40 repeat protein
MHTIQFAVAKEWADIGYGNVVSLQFRSDGRELAAVLDIGGESRIAFWDLQRKVERKAVDTRGNNIEGAIPPVLSPDFGLFAHPGEKRGEQGGLHVILSRRSRGKRVDRYLGWWWREALSAMCFSLDGRHLAVIGWDSHDADPGEGVALWDVAAVLRARASGADGPRWIERRAAATLLPADDFLMSLAFSPDGATLAAGTANQGIFRWDVATGQRLPGPTLSEPKRRWVDRLAFSLDSKLLAARSEARLGGLVLIDAATGASWPVPPKDHSSSNTADFAFHHFAFHPAGRLLATVALDNTVTFWDTASGKKQQVLTSEVGPLCCVALSPDGCTCAAGGPNGRVATWNVAG